MNVHQSTVKDAHYKPWGDHRRSPVVMVLQNERFYADFLEEMLVTLGFSVGGAFCSCVSVLSAILFALACGVASVVASFIS